MAKALKVLDDVAARPLVKARQRMQTMQSACRV
jgi:hypothetical protein